jgi:succinoglycan biosynthesis protein ExoM
MSDLKTRKARRFATSKKMKDHISICVCTYHRNQMLKRLMRTLKSQETQGLFDLSVVVVDNDSSGAARETVKRLAIELSLSIMYDVEPEQTIPAARNRALALARGNYIGIIDDDEFVAQNWLLVLYQAIQRYNAAGGLGPVYPFFAEQPPRWLLRGRFCERPVIATGAQLDWTQTRTGNVLMKRDFIDKHQLRFDLKWKTSGSDRAFFREAMKLGYRFIAVKEAPVFETVPPERWLASYYFKRSLVQGFNTYKNRKDDMVGLLRAWIPLRSAALSGSWFLATPVAACLGKHLFVKCLERGGHNLSQLLAALGIELVKKRNF